MTDHDLIDQFGIGQAIKQMYQGHHVQRAGWNGKGMWLALQLPNAQSKMTLPYLYLYTVQGDLVPWLASQADLLALDWQVVGEPSTQVTLRPAE